jgi:hypothetical protein
VKVCYEFQYTSSNIEENNGGNTVGGFNVTRPNFELISLYDQKTPFGKCFSKELIAYFISL